MFTQTANPNSVTTKDTAVAGFNLISAPSAYSPAIPEEEFHGLDAYSKGYVGLGNYKFVAYFDGNANEHMRFFSIAPIPYGEYHFVPKVLLSTARSGYPGNPNAGTTELWANIYDG